MDKNLVDVRKNPFVYRGRLYTGQVFQPSQNMSDYFLRFSSIEKLGDSSRKAVEHFKNVYKEILSLQFAGRPTSCSTTYCHICRI